LLKARSDLEFHPEFLGEFHRAGLHHFCTTSGHLKQFVNNDFADFFRVFNNSRITRENAIHVGKNLAGVGIQRAGQRNRRQVRSATASVVVSPSGVWPWKPATITMLIVREQLVDLLWADVRDAGTRMIAVG